MTDSELWAALRRMAKEEQMSIRWFGFKLGKIVQAHRRFNGRGCASQGVSLIQSGTRHLLYLGSDDGKPHVCVAGMWLTRATPH